jgi:DNA-binding GntR family transcriptional regulator
MKNIVNSTSKQNQVYELIKSRILDGTYGAGFRLVIEGLAKEIGFSSIPVREAIRRLEAEGFLVYEPNIGARVTKIDDQAYIEALTVLALLEGYATALASPYLSSNDFKLLRSIDEKMNDARSAFDLQAYGMLNSEFHHHIYEFCKQSYLISEIQKTEAKIETVRSAIFPLIPHRTTDSLAEHEELIRLMESKADTQAIEYFAREHKLQTARAFKKWKESH